MVGSIKYYFKSVNPYFRIMGFVFFLGLFVLPFIYWPSADIAFEIPRVVFFEKWVITLGIVSFVHFYRFSGKWNTPLLFILFLFVFWVFLVSYWGVDWEKSLMGNYYRRDGLSTLLFFVAFSFLSSSFLNNITIKQIINVLGISTLLLAMLTILNSVIVFMWGLSFIPGSEYPTGFTFGQPNFLGGYLVSTLAFAEQVLSRVSKPYSSILSLFLILAVCLTGSWISIGLMCVYFWVTRGLKKGVRKTGFILPLAGIIGLVSLYVFLWSEPNHLVAESRQRIYTKTFLGALERPFVGYGWSNVDYAFREVAWPILLNDDVYLDKAHNVFLEIFATTGSIGLALYLLLVSIVVHTLWKRSRGFVHKKENVYLPYLLSVVFCLLYMQGNVVSLNQELVFWLGVGLSLREN